VFARASDIPLLLHIMHHVHLDYATHITATTRTGSLRTVVGVAAALGYTHGLEVRR
jgi:hypothetical protein